ncbi:MAG: hypothetical protein OQJ84_05435 [Xanthomonadales bacterium]|nr:hypothetical protein [Xanthomonadales bacterium]
MLLVMAVYVLAVLLLCAGFYFARLPGNTRQIVRVAGTAYSTMTDASLDDLAKEKEVQKCALEMLQQTVHLIVKLLVILLVTAFPVWLATTLGWIDMETFMSFALRVDVLLVTTAAILVPVIAFRQIRKYGR